MIVPNEVATQCITLVIIDQAHKDKCGKMENNNSHKKTENKTLDKGFCSCSTPQLMRQKENKFNLVAFSFKCS